MQELKDKRCEMYGSRNPRPDVPLRRMLFCGVCGSPFRRKLCRGDVYWTCHNHDDRKDNCPVSQIPEEQIHAAFLRLYHKLRLHGEPILKQMISDLQSVRERRMLWSQDIIELNKKIFEITDQDRMLADMNKHGLVDPDIFIAQSNELAQQLRAAKQEKDRLLGVKKDDIIPKTRELMESLESMPEFLPGFDGEIFLDLVERITAEDGNALRFRLKNGLELRETIARRMC